MAVFKNNTTIRIILFVPFFVAALYAFFQFKKYRLQSKRQAINQFIGKPFPQLPLFDTAGNAVLLDLSRSENTIIDFWFRTCPGCISEMSGFGNLLKGKEQDISIISVSIDPKQAWLKTLAGDFPPLSFISKPVENWHHLQVNFPGSDTGKNNAEHLSEILKVTSYPSYFVLDKNGVIKATPASAVNYIQTSFSNENEFLLFLRSNKTWKSLQTILFVVLTVLVYNLLFNFLIAKINTKKEV
jgi:hypothetical protein